MPKSQSRPRERISFTVLAEDGQGMGPRRGGREALAKALRDCVDAGAFPFAARALGGVFELDALWRARMRSGSLTLGWPVRSVHRLKCSEELAARCWAAMMAAKEARAIAPPSPAAKLEARRGRASL